MNKKTVNRILLIIFAIVFILAAVYLGVHFYNNAKAEKEYEGINETVTDADKEEESTALNPIDFASLQQMNDEIYAWIKIDNTNIDYPVVQHDGDDAFYLKHSAIDKSYVESGAIYSEKCNQKDFSDPVTLLYGHNNYGDSMFTTLHNFEDREFFDNNEYFTVFLPERKLTYQVISAFKYDDRHIMYANNFENKEELSAFLQMIQNPEAEQKNVRTELDTAIDENSKIAVLSTCVTGDKSSRYLVCAVLVKDEKTK